MKSIYENKEFAAYWNLRCGDEGEPLKSQVLDPIMLELLGDLSGKELVEVGCGNGYLGNVLLTYNPVKIIMIDISPHNLKYAKEKNIDARFEFVQQDITQVTTLENSSVDLVYSNMVFSEVDDIATAFKNIFNILRTGGKFVFSIIHPGWDIFAYAQKMAGVESQKMPNIQNYFHRGFVSFVMGKNNKDKSHLKEINKLFEVEHFQRPLSDYLNTLISAGFVIDKVIEPQLHTEFISKNPNFAEYEGFPIVMVISCEKIRLETSDIA